MGIKSVCVSVYVHVAVTRRINIESATKVNLIYF